MDLDPKKCYSCGKTFTKLIDIERHKKRKTPCLIVEVNEVDRNNPKRCIFCNRIFVQKQGLVRHHKTCKIKNGGMEILADNVRFEQEIRVLKELREKDEKEKKEKDDAIKAQNDMIKDLMARVDAIEKEKQGKQEKQGDKHTTIINGDQINNINIVINNFDNPNTKFLVNQDDLSSSYFVDIYKKNRVQTPLALIPILWYNPEHPENYSIYLVNKSNGEVLIHVDGKWVVNTRDEISKCLRDKAYELTNSTIREIRKKFPNIFDPYIVGNISQNQFDDEATPCELNRVSAMLLDGRNLVKPYIKQ